MEMRKEIEIILGEEDEENQATILLGDFNGHITLLGRNGKMRMEVWSWILLIILG